MSRSVNKVILLGNLTRDPEIRYTPQGSAVASFGLATNREFNGQDGVKKEVVDFHNIVAWNKLAELCGQLLKKGTKVFVEGRLQTREWNDPQGNKRYKTEVVIDSMIRLTSTRSGEEGASEEEGTYNEGFSDNNSAAQDIDLNDINLDDILSS